MEGENNTNSSDDQLQTPWVLALEAVNGEVPRPRRPSTPGRKVLNSSEDLPSTEEMNGFKVQSFTINTRESNVVLLDNEDIPTSFASTQPPLLASATDPNVGYKTPSF
ncbi:Uncharacterized protein Adt_41025 [Abeliophyllum distichum]|uniref:Uncharacterized protein n=1 Tax=Abeliophyllum distichum TaxID=126358 RepID=A0ABD1PQB1_9LAMI